MVGLPDLLVHLCSTLWDQIHGLYGNTSKSLGSMYDGAAAVLTDARTVTFST